MKNQNINSTVIDGHTGLVDLSGNPLMSVEMSGANRGARFDRELMSWAPALRSADADLLPDMKTLVARAQDLSGNYAIASGSTQMQLDYVIGSGLKLSSKPDWRVLGLDQEWAAEWSREVESKFRAWAEDPDCYSDASRRLPFSARVGLAYRTYMIQGEILATAEWLTERGSPYSTAIQIIDPSRLSNPNGLFNSDRLRAGIEMDSMGASTAYHIRSALQSDNRFGSDTYTWKRVPRETKWGRPQVIHIFDRERPGQTRGKSKMAPVLSWAKRIESFQDVSLEAAFINAMYAAVIETDFNYAAASDLMGADEAGTAAEKLISSKAEFHGGAGVKMDGVKIPHLYPGEKLSFTSSNHPGPNFADFEKSALRHFAAGSNLSYEMVSRDYSETNYSGARAGMMHAWKFLMGRRDLIGAKYATFEFSLWLEEAIDKGDVKLPPGAPDFYEAKSAYTKSRWLGPGEGNIDPLKESKADDLEMDMGTLTLEDACAKRGLDWEENLEQLAREKKRMEDLGISRADIRGYMTPEPPSE